MSLSRRAFLGAMPVGGLALSSPWWVGWVAKHFGPTGTIHDRKVRVATAAETEWVNDNPHWNRVWVEERPGAFADQSISAMDSMLKETYSERDPTSEAYLRKNLADTKEFVREVEQHDADIIAKAAQNTKGWQYANDEWGKQVQANWDNEELQTALARSRPGFYNRKTGLFVAS